MNLSTPLYAIEGIGSTLAKRLERLNLFTVEDLVHHYPFRYEDYTKLSSISKITLDEVVTVQAEVWSIKNTYTRYGKVLTKAILNDATGSIEVTWFSQPWLAKSIKVGDTLQISGKVGKYGSKLSVVSPLWEKVDPGEKGVHTGRIVPVYPETFGISSKWIRNKLAAILPKVISDESDPLPDFIKKDKLPLKRALMQIHFPESLDQVRKAKERLAFDEIFFIQLATLKTRLDWRDKIPTKPLKINENDLESFYKVLDFKLTNAQKKVVFEIIKDLEKGVPMNRLVQGEVGSGKTVVAAAIIYLTFLNNLKSYFMAPTEVLAFQHFANLTKLLSDFNIKVGIYTGSKKQITGADVVVGTHALLSKKINLEDVGLVVVDEQQRFGVEQRTLLRTKSKIPHFLTMTATPIPRTVALTLYGDLDISIISELPKGRIPVRTHVVPSFKRDDAYRFITGKVLEGDQVYIITPLIEQSETLSTAKAAKVEYERLQKEIFPKLTLGLLHGKLRSKEKEAVLNKFKNGEIQILVSTSVVEVGVDVANATIMVIEGAERFGLAQLHQLRGRVGRGEKQSFCFLFSEVEDKAFLNRLKLLEKTFDGLALSELDLKIRGSGQIFGVLQSGRFDLKVASFKDIKLIDEVKRDVENLLNLNPALDKYPQLAGKLSKLAQGVMPD